jgi:hypothetical protein
MLRLLLSDRQRLRQQKQELLEMAARLSSFKFLNRLFNQPMLAQEIQVLFHLTVHCPYRELERPLTNVLGGSSRSKGNEISI